MTCRTSACAVWVVQYTVHTKCSGWFVIMDHETMQKCIPHHVQNNTMRAYLLIHGGVGNDVGHQHRQ